MPAQIDIIIPVYNEADNVQLLVERLSRSLGQAGVSYHLFFVDDRSTDNTVAILEQLKKKFPIKILNKKGEQGKAFSILEGAAASKAPYLAMIDADLQYPPESIPAMLKLAETHGVVVARRKDYQESRLRKVMSSTFQWFFGKVLHGLDCDVQSGLKVFKREIIQKVSIKDVTPWTLDIPLLTTALNLGFSIGQIDITFEKREKGVSKIEFFSSIREIGGQAISYKLKEKTPFLINPSRKDSMIGAGVIHKGQKFITHTTLRPGSSALDVVTPKQQLTIIGIFLTLLVCFLIVPLSTAKVFVGVLSLIYFLDVVFNFYVILRSLHYPPEIKISKSETALLKDKDLPVYTILCPLYREAHVIPQFLTAIEQLEWPKKKLDVQLLLEEDDKESIEEVGKMKLPKYVRVVVVPDSQPKTKPKACNFGLSKAKGEYVVVYDAEDAPHPLQLKKSYLAFQKVGPNIKCLQAKLNYYNPNQNWLTRLFTAEYSLWFDVILTGLQSIETAIPLGGTSNHFRKKDLLDLQGWDPFNVTEDCDLGVRLFNYGYKTAIINSTTLEEANSNFHNWIRQRSRWIKGYMQTYLLHMRNPLQLLRDQGIHAFLFQLNVGGKISFILINPILWVLTLSYFVLYAIVGPTIEALYPSVIFYMAVFSLLFGNFMFIYYYMIGVAKRDHWTLMKWIYLIPIYWLMVSISGAIALYQLIVKPHYWEKTIHGLHLKAKKEVEKVEKETVARVAAEAMTQQVGGERRIFALSAKVISKTRLAFAQLYRKQKQTVIRLISSQEYRGAFFLVAATMLANVLNMLTNLYLGNALKLSDFAILNTFMSLSYLAGIFLSGISSTVNHQTALLAGKYQLKAIPELWEHLLRRLTFAGLVIAGLWVMVSPFLYQFLRFPNILPVLIFAPFLLISFMGTVNGGYLRGVLRFDVVAIAVLVEPVIRLVTSVVVGQLDYGQYVYLTVPFASFIGLLVTLAMLMSLRKEQPARTYRHKELRMPRMFFVLSILSGLASIAFFSLDNILIVHFLGAEEAGKYGLLGLLGKMIYFAGGLVVSFVLPLISYKEGKGEKSESMFAKLFLATLGISVISYLVVGVLVPVAAPYFLGTKINAIRSLLPVYAMGVLLYTLSQTIVQYHLAKRNYAFSLASFVLAVLQILILWLFHHSLWQVVIVMFVIGLFNLVTLTTFHYYRAKLNFLFSNVQDFVDLFSILPKTPKQFTKKSSYQILIFNWRDPKHVWAGGAETYIHELSKRLVAAGHQVILFCGNDGKHSRTEVIDGVNIVRRGGFYTVYIWAMIYYLFRFRSQTDIVIDSENGVPFFTPLFVRKPIFLLIHHIHQDVFRKHLRFPFSELAGMMEADLMPWLYRDQAIVTVSESSKQDIADIGLGTEESIAVVNPGIDLKQFSKKKKTKHPTIVYVGRLKNYKNIDIAIKALKQVLIKVPKATLTIAGEGEAMADLKKLVKTLELEGAVNFVGRISEQEKYQLLATAWVAVQPSMVEGWGITVIEANASGTPVVASNVKGLRDSIIHDKTGKLVKPKDPKEMADALVSILTNQRTRVRLSNAAYNWSNNFDWEHSTKQFSQVIEQHLQTEAQVLTQPASLNLHEK